MARLRRALKHYFGGTLTWRTAWRVAADPSVKFSGPHFQLRKRDDGYLYIEPRA